MKILVIGGGPAGATAARLLAKDFDVTLIQERDWDKPCGGGVKSKVFNEFEIPKELIKHKINSLEIKYKNSLIHLDLKGENLSIVKRDEFDKTLRDLAIKNGAKFYYGRFKGFKDKKAVIKTKNEKILFDYDILIAADGVNSSVRKALNLKEVPKIITHYAKTTEYQVKTCEFFFDKKIAGDYYAWAFPHIDKTHIGSVGESFSNLCEYLNLNIKPKGYFIPTWEENITIQQDNVFFVGDAAGQVMPLSFEGIYYAINSAKILANSIKHNLDYQTEWKKRFLKEFKFMKFLENLMKKPISRSLMINLLKTKMFQDFSVNLWLKGMK